MNDSLDNTVLPMASSLVTDVNKTVSLTLESSLVTNMAPILTNGALEYMALPMNYPRLYPRYYPRYYQWFYP